MADAALLIACDSLLSLIRHRECSGLTPQTVADLDALIPPLRARTDQIIHDLLPARDPDPAWHAANQLTCPVCGMNDGPCTGHTVNGVLIERNHQARIDLTPQDCTP